MTPDSTNPKKFAALIKKLKSRFKPAEPAKREAVAQLVVSMLQWESTARAAELAFSNIMGAMVDINELRVSFTDEVVDLIGEDYPLAEERIARLREALNEIYLREHDAAMRSVTDKAKKDQRAYLESLPGLPQYSIAHVMLVAHGGHAIPVDTKLVALLALEKVVDPDLTPEQVESFLLRQVKAGDMLAAHLVLQAWADGRKRPPVPVSEMENAAVGGRVTGRSPKKSSRRLVRRVKKK